MKGATPDTVEERLVIFDKLRVERVKTIIEYTRDMAPRKASGTSTGKELNHKTTQRYSDYYWSYKITQEAVAAMREHGIDMNLRNVATGEISIS